MARHPFFLEPDHLHRGRVSPFLARPAFQGASMVTIGISSKFDEQAPRRKHSGSTDSRNCFPSASIFGTTKSNRQLRLKTGRLATDSRYQKSRQLTRPISFLKIFIRLVVINDTRISGGIS